MEQARRDVPDLVAARRFELHDGQGRTRAVIGDLSRGGEEWSPGVSLLDDEGNERLTLTLSSGGPVLSVVSEGNVVLEVGARDPHPENLLVGSYVVLSDGSGAMAWRIFVTEQGTIVDVPPVAPPD